ncbi:MAG: hypothetical protein JWO80_6411 [Bryobacterales bacterium]|nr:hypothetical protein [Bryobacterales bacterium]
MGATHVKALRSLPGVELTAVVSSDVNKLSGDLSGIHGNIGGAGETMDFSGIARYATLRECLRDENVEAVDLCVPTDLHEEMAVASLRAGKHVLVEKPIALDEASAGRMIEEARRAGRVLMCAQVLRFFPNYRLAAETLASLGPMRSAMFRRRCGAPSWSRWLGDPTRSGGAVFDLLIHDVDYAVKLFGIPQSISATGFTDMRFGIDWIIAEFRYEQFGPVVVEGGWFYPHSYPFSMEFTIMAENGTLDYSSAGQPLRLFGPEGEGHALDLPEADGYAEELAYFADCASHGLQPERCPPADSALAVRLMRLMLESRKREGERLAVSGPELHHVR